MRTYERTHPWLKFEPNLNKIDHCLWTLLGEAKSKCDHLAGVPLRPDTAQDLHRLYLARGVLATTAIEGNTLSEQDVLQLLDKKLRLPPSKAYLAQEVDNIVHACNFIWERIETEKQSLLDVKTARELNLLVLRNLKLDEGIVPGEVRQFVVNVGRYRAVEPQDCEYLLQKFCGFLSVDLSDLGVDQIVIGIIKAVLGHAYFELVHPFADGNGRTGRLIEFFVLLSAGVPTAAAHLLSNFYNQTRTEYYRQLDYISQSKGDVFPFLKYAVTGFVDGLREQIAVVQDQQLAIMWRNYIHETFRDETSKVAKRRCDLALAISSYTMSRGAPVSFEKLISSNAKIAATYANKTKKTFQRDIAVLEKKELIQIVPGGVRAIPETILAFRPGRLE